MQCSTCNEQCFLLNLSITWSYSQKSPNFKLPLSVVRMTQPQNRWKERVRREKRRGKGSGKMGRFNDKKMLFYKSSMLCFLCVSDNSKHFSIFFEKNRIFSRKLHMGQNDPRSDNSLSFRVNSKRVKRRTVKI